MATDKLVAKLQMCLQCLLVGILPLLVYPFWDDVVLAPKLALASVCASLLCFTLLIQARSLNWKRIGRSASGCFCLLAVFILLGYLVFGNAEGTLIAYQWALLLTVGLAFWMVPTVGAQNAETKWRIDWLDAFLVSGWFLTCVYGQMQRVGWDLIEWDHPELSRVRMIAGLGNPNHMGLYLAFLSPFVFHWSVSRRQGVIAKLAGLSVFGLGILTIFMSATRASMVAIAAAFLFQSSLWWRKREDGLFRFRLAALWATTALSLLLTFAFDRQRGTDLSIGSRLGSIADTSHESNSSRLLLWKVASLESLKRPWGHSYDRFGYSYQMYRDQEPWRMRLLSRRAEHPHNFYLELLYSAGVLGLGLWILALYRALRDSVTETEDFGIGASLIGLMVNSVFITIELPSLMLVLWLLFKADHLNKRVEEEEVSPSGSVRLGLLCAGLFFAYMCGSIVLAQRGIWDCNETIAKNREVGHPLPFGAYRSAMGYLSDASNWGPPWKDREISRKVLELGRYQMACGGQLPVPVVEGLLKLGLQQREKYPLDCHSSLDLARTIRVMGDRRLGPIATEAFAKAVELEPYSPKVRLEYSQWLWSMGDYSKAYEQGQLVTEQVPLWEEGWVHLALCLHSLGREAEAEKLWADLTSKHQGEALVRPW